MLPKDLFKDPELEAYIHNGFPIYQLAAICASMILSGIVSKEGVGIMRIREKKAMESAKRIIELSFKED